MYWLNIDIPTRICTLHLDGCRTKPTVEPGFKGFGRMKRDGGWFVFSSSQETSAHYKQEWKTRGYDWIQCSRCGL